ncbi:hypothetical protein P4S72_15020 [Vibrio sp. PP-XX7]
MINIRSVIYEIKPFFSECRSFGRHHRTFYLVNARNLDKVVFGTNWFQLEAEHGGFYQAQAEGIYKKYGLDVEIKMGGHR